MSKEELKKKIVDVLTEATGTWFDNDHNWEGDPEERDESFKRHCADALIAAVIEHVKEAERCAEVAERAGRIIQRDMARVFDISNPRICELIANIWDLAKKQAEKELAEELKNERL